MPFGEMRHGSVALRPNPMLIRTTFVLLIGIVLDPVGSERLETAPAGPPLPGKCPTSRSVPTTSDGEDATVPLHPSAGDRWQIAIEHPYLASVGLEELLAGIRYVVHISAKDTFEAFLIQSTESDRPFGIFSHVFENHQAIICNESRNVVYSQSFQKMSSQTFFWTTGNVGRYDKVNFTAHIFYGGKWHWKTTILHFRQECLHYITSTDGLLQETNLLSQDLHNCSENLLIIPVPEDYQTFIQFQMVNLLFSKLSECSKEYIEVLSVADDWMSHKFCGYLDNRKLSRLHFTSRREAVIFRVKILNSSTFKAVYYVLDRRKGCNSTVTSSEGQISSPNFPSVYYPGLDCYIHVVVPEGRMAVLRLRRLHLQLYNNGSCGSDFLEILSPSGSGRQFCGHLQRYTRQYTTYFTPRSVVLHFHSDWMEGEEGGGFLLDYAMSVTCGQNVHRDASAILFRPDSTPADRGASSTLRGDWENCFTTIYVPYGYVIELRVHSTWNHSLSEGVRFVPVHNDTDAILNGSSSNCSDGFVELVERDVSWTVCDMKSVINVSRVTTGNTLLVRVIRNRSGPRPSITISYIAIPTSQSQLECDYGWVSGLDHCYLMVEEPSSWDQAKEACQTKGGHLVSVTNYKIQLLLDAIINNSLLRDESSAVWTGGNDRSCENCYEWADGKPISYTNWFKGWPDFNYYNCQPSDDGLSNQDCIEMRRTFLYPAKGNGKTSGFYWNDRDCSVANPFICEKLKAGVTILPYPTSCNASISLTRVRTKDVVTSPAFPDPYPGDMDCTIVVTAPPEYKIVLTFPTFVLEDGQLCQYDYLEILSNSSEPRRFCGDWTNRLKLLRHESSSNHLILKFVSDHSHSYAGFVANVHLEGDRLCDDDRLVRYNNYCYLFVTYPTVTWHTANQICSEMQGHLTSVASREEEAFLLEQISKSSATVFWLGGFKSSSSNSWSWTDSSPFVYTAFYSEQKAKQIGNLITETPDFSGMDRSAKPFCLSLQWASERQRSQHYWFGEECDRFANYICKKKSYANGEDLNETREGESGNVTSPAFPFTYPNNLHYTVTILGPPKSRIVIKLVYLDLEWQEECLYDYVGIQSSELKPMTRLCGSHVKRDVRWEFIADANVAHLTFHSDFSETGGGFHASWKAVDVSGCPSRFLTSESGSLASVNYPNPYFNSLDCETIVKAPAKGWMWLEFESFAVGFGRGGDLLKNICPDDFVEISLWHGPLTTIQLCGNLTSHLPNLAFMGQASDLKVAFHSDIQGQFGGFRAHYAALAVPFMERVVFLLPNVTGIVRELNYPLSPPSGVNYTRKLVAPVGYIVELRLEGINSQWLDANVSSCESWSMEVADPYRPQGSPLATLCRADNESTIDAFIIRSYYNVLGLRELTGNAPNLLGHFKVTYEVRKDPEFVNKTRTGSRSIQSCHPNSCLNDGSCASVDGVHVCKCRGHFVGMFCHLTECDLNPCVHGACNLTEGGHVCACRRGYGGTRCETKLNPCAQNPCGSRGICLVENDHFVCRCNIWWQGPLCEKKVLKIPYKPLSQRMLEEPFWLGLITVFVVLTVLGLVWCIKRKFADKLEKFIAEEIEKSKQNQSCKANKRQSLRDQSSPVSLSPQTCPRSLLSRIGLRKHSMLSLDSGGSPNYHENRSFSFEDIMKKSDSQKRLDKRSPSPAQFNKTELLHSLVAPPTSPRERRMSLDEFIQMSEKKILERKNSRESTCESKSPDEETSFGNGLLAANRLAFRKRVNFVRRLEKIDSVSFENDREEEQLGVVTSCPNDDDDHYLGVSGGGDVSDAGSSCSSRISGSCEVPELMFSDSANEMEPVARRTDVRHVQRIPDHSDCSSAEVDSSWTSSEVLDNVRSEVQVEIHQVPKEAKEMTRENLQSNEKRDDALANDGTGPMVMISCPLVPKQSQCPSTGGNVLRIDPNVPDCCRVPSPKRLNCFNAVGDCLAPRLKKPLSEEELKQRGNCSLMTPLPNQHFSRPAFKLVGQKQDNLAPSGTTPPPHPASFHSLLQMKPELVKLCVPPSPLLEQRFGKVHDSLSKAPHLRPGSPTVGLRLKPPNTEVCAYNVVEHVHLGKGRPLSPLETVVAPAQSPSSYKKRVHELDKTGSLDLPAPVITITSNVSSCESDTDSPTKTTTRMHYLSPFDMIRQSSERSTSLSNLSSSGYSSMASPGPSRCNSNSPLFGADLDGDPSGGSQGLRPSPTNLSRIYGHHLCPSNIPLPTSPRRCSPTGPTTPKTRIPNGPTQRVRPPLLRTLSVARKRSDSETTDEQPEPGSLPEDSNDDEGIGMDHIDFKIHRGEVTSAKDLELYMDREKASPVDVDEPSGGPATSKDFVGAGHEFVCPAIVVQTLLQNEPDRDRCWKFVRRKSFQRKLSPVSSRSESPMSDRSCQNPNEKFSSLFFGNENGNNAMAYTDSDELYDGPSSEVVGSPSDPKPTPQPRKQTRRREKSHGSKTKSSCHKLRSKSQMEAPKEPPCKRSPKRRLRVQNSVDADSSSSESSSSMASPKEPLLVKEHRNNPGRGDCIPPYRKRMLSRCESLPLPMRQNRIRDSEACSGPFPAAFPLINLEEAAPSCKVPSADGTEAVVGTIGKASHVASPPWTDGRQDVLAARSNPVGMQNGVDVFPESTVLLNREADSRVTEESSHSEVELWEVSKQPDSGNSDFSEDSGSEVSFYLNNSTAAQQKAEHQRLLSPARISPDMAIICYSGGGFGRKCSDDEDSGLV